LAQGYRILESLFPNIGKELQAAGAIPIDWNRELYHFHIDKGGWNATLASPSPLVSVTCTRPLLEATLRQQVAKLENVSFQQQCRVVGLLDNASQNRVVGVSLYDFHRKTKEERNGELVVDASGRGSQLPHWLQQLGYQPPPATVVDPLLGYATCRYRIPADKQPEGKVILIEHSPPDGTRLGYLALVEGEEWIATLGGYGRDYPPLDEKGFLEFAKSLPSPIFYEAIHEAQLTTPICAHRATANRLYRYEEVRLPVGLVAVGDAVCAPCPYYGQGMTMGGISSMVLQTWLQQEASKDSEQRFVSERFHKQLAKRYASPWSIATQQDSQFTTTQGAIAFDWFSWWLNQYINWVARQAHHDAQFHAYLMGVHQMVRSPVALFHPWVAFQAMRNRMKK
jgi:2-polyprenyl-6-methoxyphenol hydroxylase-like FAD-dependent oxidoreductase